MRLLTIQSNHNKIFSYLLAQRLILFVALSEYLRRLIQEKAAYSYDADSNLSSLALKDVSSNILTSTTYGYDRVGNRTSITTTPGNGETAPAQPMGPYIYYSNNAIYDDGTYTYAYTYNFNLISKTKKATGAVTNYTWDYNNRLIQVQFPDGTTAQYKYDPFGRRIEKNVNGNITQYLYDNQDILFEYDGSGNVLRAYTHGSRIDEPLIMSSNGSTYYYHADALGSITSISDSTGTVVQRNIYAPFGSIQSGNTLAQPYAFTGREYDPETGMYYYRARYYDPVLGRFISKDPILHPANAPPKGSLIPVFELLSENPQNLNPFVIADNNPINYTDPLGLYGTKDCSYYEQACKTNGGIYECYIVEHACNSFPKGNKTMDCIRQCLQERHRARQPKDVCSEKGKTGWSDFFSEHASCFVGCALNPENPYIPLGGPDLPSDNPRLY